MIQLVGQKKVDFYLNDEKIPIKSFDDYVTMYLGTQEEYPRVYKRFSERWEEKLP